MDGDTFLEGDGPDERGHVVPSARAKELYDACEADDGRRARELLEAGVPPTFVHPEGGWTALHWAANHGKVEIVKALLAKGASPARKACGAAERANTPLHWAAYRGHLRAVWVLLEAGYGPDDVDGVGNTALHLAASSGHASVVEVLLDDGADARVQNDFHNTALDLATDGASRDLLEGALSRPAPSPSDRERRHASNLERYRKAQADVRSAASDWESRSTASFDDCVDRLRAAMSLAERLCVPEAVLEEGRAGEVAIVRRKQLRSLEERLRSNSPVLSQAQYVELVNPLRRLLGELQAGGAQAGGSSLSSAEAAVERAHCEFWLQRELGQLQGVACAGEGTVRLMKRLEGAIERAERAGADASKLAEAKGRLEVLDGELELQRALRSVPAVRLPIEAEPKDYWEDGDRGRVWDEYPEYPLPPQLAEGQEGAPGYKWIPSESLATLRAAVARIAGALEAASEAKVNDEVKGAAEASLEKSSAELKQLENKDAADRAQALVAVEKAAKKLKKKGKGKKK